MTKNTLQPKSSFVPQRDDRINARCAARRDVGCRQGHTAKEQGHKKKRRRIGQANFIKEIPEKMRQAKRPYNSEGNTPSNYANSLPQYHPNHMPAPRPQSYANTNFMRSPCHRERQHAIDTNGCQ